MAFHCLPLRVYTCLYLQLVSLYKAPLSTPVLVSHLDLLVVGNQVSRLYILSIIYSLSCWEPVIKPCSTVSHSVTTYSVSQTCQFHPKYALLFYSHFLSIFSLHLWTIILVFPFQVVSSHSHVPAHPYSVFMFTFLFGSLSSHVSCSFISSYLSPDSGFPS